MGKFRQIFMELSARDMPIFSFPDDNFYFIVQERFNKLIHGINTIIKCDTWQPVKFQSVSRIWNEMIFLSYLWINVANINSEIW